MRTCNLKKMNRRLGHPGDERERWTLQKVEKELLDNFEDTGFATNKKNEEVLTKTLKKVIAHNKKMALKPIATRILI